MLLSSLLLAVILSLDAMAVSIANGMCADLKPFHAIRASLFFGAFQFAMPIAGWVFGAFFHRYIVAFSHWLAFGLLVFVGGKMIKESFGIRDPMACTDEEKARSDVRDLKTLFVLSVATSIDALAVGLSYSALGTPIMGPAIIIGIVTFALCMAGIEFGKRIGARFERWSNLAGGVILIGLGLKALI